MNADAIINDKTRQPSINEIEKRLEVLQTALKQLTEAVSVLQRIKNESEIALFKHFESHFPLEGVDFVEKKREYEIRLVKGALRKTGGRQAAAARLLRIKASTLHSIIKRNEIS